MLASTASAPRVTRCSLGLYWSRDLCTAGWGMLSYLGQIVRGSEIWWFMSSAHSLSTSLRYQWPLIAGWGLAFLPELKDEKKYFGYVISSRSNRYVSLLEQTNTPTYTHACTHAQIHTTPHPSVKGHWYVPKFTITCVRLRLHAIVVMKVFPELFIEASWLAQDPDEV